MTLPYYASHPLHMTHSSPIIHALLFVMARARELAGPSRVLAGNVDPMHLYGRWERRTRDWRLGINPPYGLYIIHTNPLRLVYNTYLPVMYPLATCSISSSNGTFLLPSTHNPLLTPQDASTSLPLMIDNALLHILWPKPPPLAYLTYLLPTTHLSIWLLSYLSDLHAFSLYHSSLYHSEKDITAAVTNCIHQAKGHHVLNLGHGVEKDTPEENVRVFVHAARHVKI